jgi:hypothetical protein
MTTSSSFSWAVVGIGQRHTHAAFLEPLGPSGQVVLNVGTWLKLLRVPVHFGSLPAVYYPSYRLNYFCIDKQNNHLVITYVTVPKTPGRELTSLHRGNVMRKMGAKSLAELVRMADALGVRQTK